MEALSERYGWTPEQIKKMERKDLLHYWKIIGIKNKLENIKLKELNRK